jgi:hypothetical protein
MRGSLERLRKSAPEPVANRAGKLTKTIEIDTQSLDTFRLGFRGLSDAMIEFVRFVPPRDSVAPAVFHAYCPMEKANWLQLGKEITNPYAPHMLRCGSIKDEFEAIASDGGEP